MLNQFEKIKFKLMLTGIKLEIIDLTYNTIMKESIM